MSNMLYSTDFLM